MVEPMLLILGGNSMACPAIAELERQGYRTLVMDGNPSAKAKEVATLFKPVNFFYEKQVLQALEGVRIMGVMALNDFGVRTASAIAKTLDLPGYNRTSAFSLTNKVIMKKIWGLHKLPSAPFSYGRISDVLKGRFSDHVRFPCVIKPAFSGGGSRGVSLVHSFKDLRDQVTQRENYCLDGEVLVEDYMAGCTEHTVEVLIYRGSPTILSISDKINYTNSVTIVQTLFFPGEHGWSNQKIISDIVTEACHALELTDGCAHFEVLLRNGEAFLLEVSGRPGGGLNFAPICELSTGYNYPLELARVLTGEAPLLNCNNRTHVIGWHFFELPLGRLKRIRGFELVKAHPAVIAAELFINQGDQVQQMENDLQRPGYLLVKGDSCRQVESILKELVNTVEFEIEEATARVAA